MMRIFSGKPSDIPQPQTRNALEAHDRTPEDGSEGLLIDRKSMENDNGGRITPDCVWWSARPKKQESKCTPSHAGAASVPGMPEDYISELEIKDDWVSVTKAPDHATLDSEISNDWTYILPEIHDFCPEIQDDEDREKFISNVAALLCQLKNGNWFCIEGKYAVLIEMMKEKSISAPDLQKPLFDAYRSALKQKREKFSVRLLEIMTENAVSAGVKTKDITDVQNK